MLSVSGIFTSKLNSTLSIGQSLIDESLPPVAINFQSLQTATPHTDFPTCPSRIQTSSPVSKFQIIPFVSSEVETI